MNKGMGWIKALLLLAAGASLAAPAAETHSFSSINKLIPDGNLAGLSDRHTIASSVLRVDAVRVSLRIAGEFNGDLYAYLRHLQGGRTNLCVLLNRPGRTAAHPAGYADAGLEVVFDDHAVQGDIHFYRDGVTPLPGERLTGTWQPDGRKVDPLMVSELASRTATLGEFAGADANGEWTLYLVDTDSGGTNLLVNWGLEIDGAIAAPVTWLPTADIIYGTPLGAGQLNASSSVAGTFTYNPPANTVLSAGDAQILSVTFTPDDLVTYVPVSTTVPINVLPAPVTITANGATKVYGAANPALSAVVSGEVPGGDAIAYTLSTTATALSGVGSYPVTVSLGVNPNYAVTATDAALTISAKAATILANDVTKTYGTANPALSAVVSGEVAGGDAIAYTLSTTATALSGVGSYPVTVSLGANPNYAVTATDAALTVEPAELTITANDVSKVYGAALPTFSASYSGFVLGEGPEVLTAPVTFSTAATPASNVGTYSIAPGGASAANYLIAFVAGTLTVEPAALTITANDVSKVYGASLPQFTAACTGFVNNDTEACLTAPFTLWSLAEDVSAVGAYAITVGGATAANYVVTFVSGTLTITPAATAGLVVTSANPALPGDPVIFTCTLSTLPPGAGTPTGTVQFKVDGVNAGTPVPLAGGSAAHSTTSLAAGWHQITAEYAGSLNFLGATNTLAPDQLINTPPVAGADTIERWPTNDVSVAIATLLANDTDADGDAISFVSFNPLSAHNGTVTEESGTLRYTPAAGFQEADTFTYTISDGRGEPVTGTVTVAIRAPAPNLAIVRLGGGVCRISFSGIPGITYRVEATETLAPVNWQPSGIGTASEAGRVEIMDTPPAGSRQRFYRAVVP